jgi:hypothetical protein
MCDKENSPSFRAPRPLMIHQSGEGFSPLRPVDVSARANTRPPLSPYSKPSSDSPFQKGLEYLGSPFQKLTRREVLPHPRSSFATLSCIAIPT